VKPKPKVTFHNGGKVSVREYGKIPVMVGEWRRIALASGYNFSFTSVDNASANPIISGMRKYLRDYAIKTYERLKNEKARDFRT